MNEYAIEYLFFEYQIVLDYRHNVLPDVPTKFVTSISIGYQSS
jgi:hypothetical protein